MGLFEFFKILFIISFILITFPENSICLFKLTKANCETYDKTYLLVNQCRLHAIRRNVAAFDMNLTLLRPASVAHVHIELFKKASGYKPFLVNLTIDACEYAEKRNNPVANIIYGLFKDYSNLNHSCPYEGHILIKGFTLQRELLKLPMPNGDYLLELTFFFHHQKVVLVSAFVETFLMFDK